MERGITKLIGAFKAVPGSITTCMVEEALSR